MADVDFASLAQEQPYVVAAVLGLIGIVLFLLLGRKSYGPVPSASLFALIAMNIGSQDVPLETVGARQSPSCSYQTAI